MALIVSFVLGLLFGIGLLLSGMTQPAKVKGFLDIAGAWDPSLALVMAGAISVALLPFRLGARRGKAWLGGDMPRQEALPVDAALIVGSLVFGIGWGLGGYCPGPALVGLGAGIPAAALFVLAMVLGIEARNWLDARERAG